MEIKQAARTSRFGKSETRYIRENGCTGASARDGCTLSMPTSLERWDLNFDPSSQDPLAYLSEYSKALASWTIDYF